MKNRILIATLVIVILILAFALIGRQSSSTTPPASTTVPTGNSSPVEISGKITNISQNPEQIMVATDNGGSYTLLIVSSTQLIRDVGGTVNGTFNFSSLHVGDSVGIQGNVNSDGTITPILVEQMNSQGIN
jgi:hypothetical protein